jgi:crossover junction endodeoxyribonuclease RuvC
MTTLGIDPGSHRIGYGLIRESSKPELLSCGLIEISETHALRLDSLYEQISALLDSAKPDSVAIERLFFNKNQKTFSAVSHARGVILLAVQQRAIPYIELTPLEVKQAIGGSGRADKKTLSFFATRMLGVASIPGPDDVSDAVAIALAGARRLRSLIPKTS